MEFDYHGGSIVKDDLVLGKDAQGNYYTIEVGTNFYIGDDGQGVANRVIPLSDVSAQNWMGVSWTTTAQAQSNNGRMSGILPTGALISTDNVNTAYTAPTVGAKVYVNDDGKFDADNTDGADYAAGTVYPPIISGLTTILLNKNYLT